MIFLNIVRLYIFDKLIKKNGAVYEKNNFYNFNFYNGGVQYE